MIGRVLAVWAVLIAAALPAGWGLAGSAGRVARRADERRAAVRRHPAGKGSASQAPGSPAQIKVVGFGPIPLPGEKARAVRAAETTRELLRLPLQTAGLCGTPGPAGMRCDLPPHTDGRHEFEACGWYESGRPTP